MKHLVILCHPSTESLINFIGTEITRLYEKYGIEVELRDLYSMKFNSVLSSRDLDAMESGKVLDDVLIEQKLISEAEIIIFVYPIWYTGMPSMLKGYIERVFSEGFAYSVVKEGVQKLLKGKKVVIVNTFKSTNLLYNKAIGRNLSFVNEKNIFESFGMEVILQFYMEKIDSDAEHELLSTKIDELKNAIKKSLIIENNIRLNIPTFFF